MAEPGGDPRSLHGKAYVDHFEKIHTTTWRLDRLRPWIELGPEACVADFGCGNALVLDAFGDLMGEYHGIDFSEPFIEAARRRTADLESPAVHLHCGSIQDFCNANPARFDVGFALDLSEHVHDTDWLDILQQVLGALKPGGRLYVHTPNATFFLEIMKERGILLKQFPEHVAVRDRRENEALLARAGFRVRRTLFLPHYNIMRVLHPLSRLPVVGRYFQARLLIEAERPVD
jgi:SAM-dependent methyltransferase